MYLSLLINDISFLKKNKEEDIDYYIKSNLVKTTKNN